MTSPHHPEDRAFQVDLRGILELFSRHLYSSPAVYLRELTQNAVDALTQRGLLGQRFEPHIGIETPAATGDGTLRVYDNGVGLTADEMHTLLATIGRSSKRDEFDFARSDFLGQFGIGLLSAFLVTDSLVVDSRSARDPAAATVRWAASADGTYRVSTAPRPLAQPGTVVVLQRDRDRADWMTDAMVGEILTRYAQYLPVRIDLRTGAGRAALTGAPRPWEAASQDEATAWCEQHFGFTPLVSIPLAVEQAGVRGVAHVLPARVAASQSARHRVYLKGMLLGEEVGGLLPRWAFFVRCVLNAEGLRPTASREALYEDEVLAGVRDALGAQLQNWIVTLGRDYPEVMVEFMAEHAPALAAAALDDDELLPIARDWLLFESTAGPLSLADAVERYGTPVRYTPSDSQFRTLAPLARDQGLAVLNAGHTHELPLLQRFATMLSVSLQPMAATDLAAGMARVDADTARRADRFLAAAAAALADREVAVELRRFSPDSLPAVFLPDADLNARTITAAAAQGGGLFADILGAMSAGPPPASTSTLVFNGANPLITALLDAPAGSAVAAEAGRVAQGLYVLALLEAQQPVTDAERGLLNAAFLALVGRLTGSGWS